MMAGLGPEDGSSSSSVAHGTSSGGPSVAHGSGAAVIPSKSRSAINQESPSHERKTQETSPSIESTSSSRQRHREEPGNLSSASPSSAESGTGLRARTGSMCSSGKESSSGGEQLARAVRGASLAFTSSSSSSSLCSDEASGDPKPVQKLETLREETTATSLSGAVTKIADESQQVGMDIEAKQPDQEPPAGCRTGEEPKQYKSSPPTSVHSTATASLNAPFSSIGPQVVLSGVPSREARTAAASTGSLVSTGLEAAVPPVASKVKSTKEPRPHSASKPASRSSGSIPSMQMLTRTNPPDVVTHGFISSSTAAPLAQPPQPHAPQPQPHAPQPQPPPPPAARTAPSAPLRRGKWTVEEEAYVARVIQDFNSGYLNAPAGTTLRSYLSEKLHCDPMRITKKFTGDACIGKRVFHPAVRCASNSVAIDKAQAELDALEQRWRRRLEMQQRESAKKAAASAAAAAAAASGRGGSLHVSASQGPGMASATTAAGSTASVPGTGALKQNVVARTASWLDRATAVLSSSGDGVLNPPNSRSRSSNVNPKDTADHQIEDQMNEVRRLIHEGPIIQQTTAGLPHLLHASPPLPTPKSSLGMTTSTAPSYNVSDFHGVHQPLDKRPRRSSSDNASGAEDAEALVGFLNSVRAAASSERTG